MVFSPFMVFSPLRFSHQGAHHPSTTELLPGVGATYGLGQGITLLGNVHRGMGPAGASDTDVDPEISLNYARSARLRRGGLYGEAIGFYGGYSNTG